MYLSGHQDICQWVIWNEAWAFGVTDGYEKTLPSFNHRGNGNPAAYEVYGKAFAQGVLPLYYAKVGQAYIIGPVTERKYDYIWRPVFFPDSVGQGNGFVIIGEIGKQGY